MPITDTNNNTIAMDNTPMRSTTPEMHAAGGILSSTPKPDMLASNFTHNEPSVYDMCITYDLIVEALAIGALCIVGFIGNILSIICLLKDISKTATPFLLVSLEVADSLFLVTVFLLRVLTSVAQYTHWHALLPIFPYLAKYVFPAALVCQTGTIYMTLLVTVNRYLTVCRPYKASTFGSVKSAQKHVIVVWLFALIYNIPRFLQYDIQTYVDPENNVVSTVAVETAMATHRMYQILYCNALYCLVMFLLPLTTLIILNSKLVAAFKWAKEKRKELLTHSESTTKCEDDITLILIVIVVVFVICQTPALITQLLVVFLPDELKGCPKPYFFYARISDLLVVSNCSINFLIYCFCSRRYRKIFVEMVCRKEKARSDSSTGGSQPYGHARTTGLLMHTKYTTASSTPPDSVV